VVKNFVLGGKKMNDLNLEVANETVKLYFEGMTFKDALDVAKHNLEVKVDRKN
jgi:hypothetical protein